MFTDVEGSTLRWERAAEAMSAAIRRHDAIVRSAIDGRGGHVFSTAGDSFAAAFARAGDAIGAAVALQRRLHAESWPDLADVRVRVGVHSGEAEERDGNYFGPDVNRAARVMARAHGGQILVSLATAELVHGHLPADVRLLDLGEHALASVSRPEHLFQVLAPGLPADFAPLEPAAARPALRRAITSLVGRETDLEWLASKVPSQPLVTLVGPGGVGKTRVAMEAAWRLRDHFTDGVRVVELASATAPEAVLPMTAAALEVRQERERSLQDSVLDALAGRHLLLVIDNCEHVLDAAAGLAADIVAACPTISVLATSRASLRVEGEQVWPIAPLGREASALFAARARSVDPHFDADPTAIEAVCAHLDGIPLAIELAAARVRSLDVHELASRLDQRFDVLRGTTRGRERRHQTLHDVVAWSYHLLDEPEQVLFSRLGVLNPPFDLSTVEGICAGGSLDVRDIADLLDALVDQSMVLAEPSPGGTRFRLLETLREFAIAQLEHRGELIERRRRHLAHFAGEVRRAHAAYTTDGSETAAAQFEAMWANLRSAVHFGCDAGEVSAAAGLVEGTFFYSFFGWQHEHGEWAERVLAVAPERSGIAGVAAYWRIFPDIEGAVALARDTAAALLDPGAADSLLVWFALMTAAFYSNRLPEAVDASDAYLRVAQAHGTGFDVALAASMVADVHAIARQPDALTRAHEALAFAVAKRHEPLRAWCLLAVGSSELALGHQDEAADRYREALLVAEGGVNRIAELQAAVFLALRAPVGEREAAYEDAISRLYAIRFWSDLFVIVESLAAHLVGLERRQEAAVLLGHLQAHRRLHSMLARRTARTIALLGEEAEADLRRGAAMRRDELVQYALQCLGRGRDTRSS